MNRFGRSRPFGFGSTLVILTISGMQHLGSRCIAVVVGTWYDASRLPRKDLHGNHVYTAAKESFNNFLRKLLLCFLLTFCPRHAHPRPAKVNDWRRHSNSHQVLYSTLALTSAPHGYYYSEQKLNLESALLFDRFDPDFTQGYSALPPPHLMRQVESSFFFLPGGVYCESDYCRSGFVRDSVKRAL